MFHAIAQYSATMCARLILARHKPTIIAITGSIGKTTTKEACFYVLREQLRTRKSLKNFNTEIGVPLTIIGVPEPGRSLFRWVWLCVKTFMVLVLPRRLYPEVLIIELAADKPGDIAHFMNYIKPTVSIITTLSPVHLQNFRTFTHIIAEKRKIIEALPPEGYALLNSDDEVVAGLVAKTDARVMRFGVFDKNADVRAEEVGVIFKKEVPGLHFKLLIEGSATPVFVPHVGALHFITSFLAAAACGVVFRLTPLAIAQGIEQFKGEAHRFEIKRFDNGIICIDDTYNAAPLSVCAALRALRALPIHGRRIVVLGDMLELASYEKNGHEEVGECIVETEPHSVFLFGPRMKIAYEKARSAFWAKKISHFNEKKDIIAELKRSLEVGDIVLVKGSHGMKMEEVIDCIESLSDVKK